MAERLGQPGLVVVDCTVLHRSCQRVGSNLTAVSTVAEKGHIPGAVFADLLPKFADPGSKKPFGVLAVGKLAAAIEELGISNGDTVVVYDGAHTAFATWFWWLLQSIGFDNVAVLNGGWRKWAAEGRPVSTNAPEIWRGTIVPKSRPELFATREQVLAAIDDPSTCRVNALSGDQHAGRVPVAHGCSGHIPSSVNVPAVDLVDPETGAYLPTRRLAARLEEAGGTATDRVIAYCAADVNASSDAFVLKLLGVGNVAAYDGGLAEWSGDPELPLHASA